ncbi:SMC5-like protein [Podospora didyma]|uniref:Structural maintenance of chromosomes protein 5 n=1 Tax=Podospora didyma TaxID=330526 RepID=A0AAE0P4F7_9PEZI|nr:SMC5-like protein [Podospora didyma]
MANPSTKFEAASRLTRDNEPRSFPPDEFSGLHLRGGDGSRGFDDDDEEEPKQEYDEDAALPSRRRAPPSGLANGALPSGFQPGAIVRVRLENFVTYEKAEFFLGPNLNMIIGPNGTGKSSLVCAICLGLGYPSSVLGRASAYGDFVKHGKDEAEIEVELQKKLGKSENSVIGLCIKREDNSRRFTVNGQRATLKDIQALMKSFSIQIDNLCQFLPQDKVAEFAGLSPVELLEKTLQAAAPREMIKWQAELREHFKSQQEAERSAHESHEQLRKMEARQQVLQADVEKLREREEIQSTIETLHKLRLVVKYSEARKEYGELKARKKEAERKLKRLQENSAPSLEAVNKKQDYSARIQTVVDNRKAALRLAERAADEANDLVEASDRNHQEIVTKIEAEKTSFASKRRELGELRKKITDLEARYRQAPKEFDSADWNRRIREQEHLQRDKNTEVAELTEEMERTKALGQEKRREQNNYAQEINELESQQGQLFNQLKSHSSDVAKGWRWLKENQGEFEKEVFGPPMLTCSVKDKRYSDLVQSMLQQDDFLCFTAQTKDDHRKLSSQFYDKMGLSVTIRSCFTPFGSFKSPMSREQLANFGLDGFVIDYLEGPEPVLAMLCSEKRAHASAVALADVSDNQFNVIQQAEQINQFAAGRQVYRITRRREYGPGAVSTRVTLFQKGRFWTDQPVDMSEKTELQRKLDRVTTEVEDMKPKYKEMADRRKELMKTCNEIAEVAAQLRREKNELQREFSNWQTLPDKIESEKGSLARREEELAAAKLRLQDNKQTLDKVVIRKAKAILQHHDAIAGIRTAYQALLEAQLLLIEARSDVAVLKNKNSEIMQQLEAEKHLVTELAKQLAEKHRIATDARLEVEEFISDENDRNDFLLLARDRTLADLMGEISAEQAKLEVIQASNPYALEEFENWATKIERERANHAGQEARLADLNTKIDTIKSQWEPKLDELVGQINDAFSYNFEQISCAGEVGVHKDEEFDKWAIEIRVKFRENETLQRLDQHRQSGGERAVSTIFYLMSLQSMAQAPFRVVDEINQGMDPRNERMVHERMVEIACREHTSQYFLITPKLLSGLRYDERMRVHTIVSGEHVDDHGTEKMNFAKFAAIQRRVRA